ncbi:hypothetical protein O1611_g5180 [Lasiodiplodia mahajangana]|uniref:Uncharacterized protein n=1 Tax=Lasiodiplodia mahajangana TaxID=1108764 RepID=A0ACC2JLR4_9PEZI|nr:hypothetical protein O1611_g5180 [Lasiodiplodia mahajangana]
MWLLNSCTWELKEFISYKQAPPYAILSHTWGDDEILFRDWQHEDGRDVERKASFDKIKGCCHQAADDGLEWIWIDTCCIDKQSSAELSEAINSMFKWYKNAAVCYAYLFDVLDDIESHLHECRWVKRGWTLQELIAPSEVVFYSSSWQRLGTRSALSACLSAVTSINEAFLKGRSVYQASIAQRMSWAAKRETSREEDEAYCLFGMFDVNMPLIYGEGPKAFRRLQETLITQYPEDHSLFAWGNIVEKPSHSTEDMEVIWGSKPPLHEPSLVGKKLFGLLAESPRDFRDSGQFVPAPITRHVVRSVNVASVSNPVGHVANVNLPMLYGSYNLSIHLKRPAIGNGDLVMRRSIGLSPVGYVMGPNVTDNAIFSIFKIPRSFSGRALGVWFERGPEFEFMVSIIRHDALDHLHEDPSQARSGDSPSTPIGILLNEKEGLIQRTDRETFPAPTFATSEIGYNHFYCHPEDIKYKHDIVVPRDEWRIGIIGIANIHVSVERIYFDDESDDDDGDDYDSNGDKMHRFADVLDIVVTENTDGDSSNEENGDREGAEEESADEEVTGDGGTAEENVSTIEGKRQAMASLTGSNVSASREQEFPPSRARPITAQYVSEGEKTFLAFSEDLV